MSVHIPKYCTYASVNPFCEETFFVPTRMDAVIPSASAPVVDGQEVTDNHIHAELERWPPKPDWLILSPASCALFISGSEETDVALGRDGSLGNLVRDSKFVLAILATAQNSGEVADAGCHYLCVLGHRDNKTLFIYDSQDFKRSPLSKETVKKFGLRITEAFLLHVRGTYVCEH